MGRLKVRIQGSGVRYRHGNLEGFFRLDFGASMSYHIHYPSIVSALLLSIALSVLAGLYPAKRAAKTNIVEALSYE